MAVNWMSLNWNKKKTSENLWKTVFRICQINDSIRHRFSLLICSFSHLIAPEDYQGDDMGGGDFDSG